MKQKHTKSPNDMSNASFGLMRQWTVVVARSLWPWVVVVVMVVVVVKEVMVTVEGDGDGDGSDGGGALLGHHCRQSYYMYM